MLHFLRLSPAATRPAEDVQIDVGLSHEVDAPGNSARAQATTVPLGLRIGLTQWLEFGLEGNAVTDGSVSGTIPSDTALPLPAWRLLQELGAHVALGLHPGPASAVSLSLGAAVRDTGNASGLDIGRVALQGATAVASNVLLLGQLGAEGDFYRQPTGSQDLFSSGTGSTIPGGGTPISGTQASGNHAVLGAGVGMRWLSEVVGLGLDLSASHRSGQFGVTVAPALELFTGESVMVHVSGAYTRFPGNDVFGVDLGLSWEPTH